MRQMPLDIGTIHLVGIGGIGMSGIAEVLHNLGYSVSGSDVAEGANVQRLRDKGIAVAIGHHGGECRQGCGRRGVLGDPAGQPGNPGGQGRPDPGGAAGRDAGRADAPQMGHRGRRHPWQDHHHLADRSHAGRGRTRPDRDQWRHHQRLRHQCPPGRGRMDGGRGRRERRQLHPPARHHRRGHQYRPRAHGVLWLVRGAARRLRAVRDQYPLLRLRRHVHRSSRGPGDDPAGAGPASHHLRLQPAGRCPGRRSGDQCRRLALRCGDHRSRHRQEPVHGPGCICRCSGSTTCRTPWPASPSAPRWA